MKIMTAYSAVAWWVNNIVKCFVLACVFVFWMYGQFRLFLLIFFFRSEKKLSMLSTI